MIRAAAESGSSSRDERSGRATPHDAQRARRSRPRASVARGRALDPRHRAVASPRRTSAATCARSSATPTRPCSSPRTAERLVGRLSLVARSTPGESTRRRPRVSWSPRAIAARASGRRSSTQAVGWARESGVRKLELHVFPWNEPALALYELVRLRARGLSKAPLRARRRARRRHPDGVLPGGWRLDG